MNRSTAIKYSNILSILAEPEYLMILDMLMEENDYVSTNDLSDATDITERKVVNYCENLQKLGIVTQDNRNDLTYYKFTNSSNSRMIEVIWSKLF